MPSLPSKALFIRDEVDSTASVRLLSKVSETCQGLSLRGRVAVVMAAMLVIMLMVMLFLWNYKCIVIDHLCQGIKEMETPIFTKD